MEKGWAKGYGSYSNIISGESREVMRALTGGPTWTLTMQQQDFKKSFSDCIDRKCIMTTGTFTDGKNYEAMGLIFEHSYLILKIRNVKHLEKGEVTLIKLQNPWGMKECNGEWSDGHELWTQKIKARLRIKDKEEGEDEMRMAFFICLIRILQVFFEHCQCWQFQDKLYLCKLISYKQCQTVFTFYN